MSYDFVIVRKSLSINQLRAWVGPPRKSLSINELHMLLDVRELPRPHTTRDEAHYCTMKKLLDVRLLL